MQAMSWLTKNIIKNSGISSGNALSSFSTSYGKKQTLASNYPLPKVLYYRLMFLMFMVNGYGDANGCSVKIIIKRYIFSYYFPTEALFFCCIMSVSLPPLLVWYVYSVFERNEKNIHHNIVSWRHMWIFATWECISCQLYNSACDFFKFHKL